VDYLINQPSPFGSKYYNQKGWAGLHRHLRRKELVDYLMHYVYCLQSRSHDYFYIGCTDSLDGRIAEHNEGKTQSTKHYAPFRLVYYEADLSEKDAINREHMLQHHGSVKGHLKNRLK
jgi:putative endonuclease